MVDPYRNEVLFQLALAERRRLLVAAFDPLPSPLLPWPVAAVARTAGRASVRLGEWLQRLAEPCRARDCAGAGVAR